MFQINGETWFIKFVNPDSFILKMPNNKYTIGVCEDRTKTIYLSNRLRGNLLKKS